MISRDRKVRFYLGCVLVLAIIGSWLYENIAKGFNLASTTGHVTMVVIAVIIMDKQTGTFLANKLLRRSNRK